MKYLLLITTVLVLGGAIFLSSASAQTCRSDTGGYCAKLAAIAQAQGLDDLIGTKDASDIIPAIYKFGLGLVGISALIALIVGGVYYMTAGGSQDRAKKGREWLGNAVFGLVLALLSYLILNTINPDLLKRLDLNLTKITAPETPLGQDNDGRNIGTPGSSAVIGRKGQQPDSNFLQQCEKLKASGCEIRTVGNGETECDCGGEFRGQSGP